MKDAARTTVELRNVQIIAAMSEETICFTADLWLLRPAPFVPVRVGTVKNDGHGGATNARIADPATRALIENLAPTLCRRGRIPPPTGPEAVEWLLDQLLLDHIDHIERSR